MPSRYEHIRFLWCAARSNTIAVCSQKARTNGGIPLSMEASRYLCARGLRPATEAELKQAGFPDGSTGFTWRSDQRLTLPTGMRMNEIQVHAFLKKIKYVLLPNFWN
jgi:hypothetical protein